MQFPIYTLAKLEHPWYPDTMRSDGPDGPDGPDGSDTRQSRRTTGGVGHQVSRCVPMVPTSDARRCPMPDARCPTSDGPAPAVPRAPEDLPRLHQTRHFSRCFSFRNQCPPPSHRPIISKWDGLAVEMYQFGRNRLARARRLLLKLCSLCRPKV